MSDILDYFKNVSEDLKNFKDNLLNVYENPRLRTLTIIIFIIFFGVSLYVYFKFIHPNLKLDYVPNREFVGPEQDKMVVLWFYTQWCPFCKSTYSEWSSFKSDVEQKDFGIPIEFREVDCDKDAILANKYNIDEYPSIRIVYRDQVYIYDAKPDRLELMEFLKGTFPTEFNVEKSVDNFAESIENVVTGGNN